MSKILDYDEGRSTRRAEISSDSHPSSFLGVQRKIIIPTKIHKIHIYGLDCPSSIPPPISVPHKCSQIWVRSRINVQHS